MNDYISEEAAETRMLLRPDGKIDLAAAVARVRRRWDVVLAAVVVAAVLGVIYLHFASYQYSAEIDVVPTQRQDSALPGALSGLASLAGINVGSNNEAAPFALYQEVLKSPAVAQQLARDPKIMTNVFRGQWDSQAKAWVRPTFSLGNSVKSLLGVPVYAWHPPGASELLDYINDNVAVDVQPLKALVTVTYNNSDPAFARYFLQSIHGAADNYLRQRTLLRSSKYVQYLNRKLEATNIAEYRQALTNSIMEQEKQLMVASADVSFAAEPVGPVTVSDRPTTPKPSVTLLLAVLAGLVVGVILAVLAVDPFALLAFPGRLIQRFRPRQNTEARDAW